MKLENPVIAPEKIRDYLLKPLPKNDKSKFLAMAGYTPDNWQELQLDVKNFVADKEAVFVEITAFGDKYEITGPLKGRNGVTIRISTIWILEENNVTRFIKLFPDKR